MPVVTVPRILREKLTEEGAEALVELINNAEDKMKDDIIEYSEEKFERRLVEVVSELRISLERRVSEVEKKMYEIKSDLEVKISEVEKKMANYHSDIIKWMFIFWAGQIGVIVSILLIFFRK